MIRLLKARPEGIKVFDGLCSDAKYFENYDDDGPYMYQGIELLSDKAIMHIHMLRFNHAIHKKTRADWDVTVRMLLKMGIKSIVGYNPDKDDSRWPNFIILFVFRGVRIIQSAVLNINMEK